MIKINSIANINKKVKNFKANDFKKISKDFDRIFLELKADVEKKNKTLNVLNKNFNFSFKTKDLKKFKKYRSIALIGMGGSILGTEAIYNYLQSKIKKEIFFFNNLDDTQIYNLKRKKKLSNILFIIVSKSGNTIETLSNTFALNILKKNAKNIILISEKKDNFLFLLAKKLNLFYIEHKRNVGGRFSVLSEVGILPAFLMGANIVKLRLRVYDWLKEKNKQTLKNNVLKIINLINSKKLNSLIFLNYAPELEKFCYWCQQLIAESLGKKNKGFLPVISNAPKDHHSLLQLYLDGPKDKLFNIFSLDKKGKEQVKIYKNIGVKSFLNNKKIDSIKIAQKKALIKALAKKNIPCREFIIKGTNEEILGNLFSYFIIETIIVGKLLNINPFDQPAVEQVKVFTKQLLN